MFLTADYLTTNYGIDSQIALFFVDREPPANNLYWHDKLLYLRPSPGYMFIPLVVDLLCKTGIEKEQLLSENFVRTMEDVGHISALHETGKISEEQAITKCGALVRNTGSNQDWFHNVIAYFSHNTDNVFKSLATPFKALHRGDVFLFSLSSLKFPNSLFVKVAEQWFALISTLLLLDDGEDIENDQATGDENAFLESGLNSSGFDRIAELIKKNFNQISTVNPTMAGEIIRQFIELVERPSVQRLINNSL